MPIIEFNHVTKECKLGQLTNLKRTALDDIAIGAASVSNSICRSDFNHENLELALTRLTYFTNPQES